jgi:hypothetical protein
MFKHFGRVIVSIIREHTKKRSPEWPKVRKTHLEANPKCAACGNIKRMQVHHMDPYHLDPARELDPKNLISLCMGPLECHLRIGHGDDFKAYNPRVRDHAKVTLDKPEHREAVEGEAKTIRLYEET